MIVRVDPESPDPEVLARAAALLRAGALVAFPTETVYGLGAHALDPAAVRGVFAAKGRPSFNPLIVHVPGVAAARQLVAEWPDAAERLAAAFWPGPLTLVLPKRPAVPDEVTAGRPTVAIRVPAHPVARALLEAAALPLAAPSANRFTAVSPTTALHVARSLGDRVAMILDGGPTTVGIESAVVDLSTDGPRLLRAGTITRAQIEGIVGALGAADPLPADDAPRPAPGMVRRHYAPQARVHLVAPGATEGAAGLAAAAAARGETVGAILIRIPDGEVPVATRVRLPDDPAGYARGLYGALHAMDEAGCALLLVEDPPDAPGWEAVRDRISRAAHPE